MKITTLIIDDEALARQRLSDLLIDVQEVEVLGQCRNGKEAIETIEKLRPHLIFLDIQMKDMTGFDVLKKLSFKEKPLIIFVTAFDEFALKAFDYFAFDYLLKPFKDVRFQESISKAIDYIKKGNISSFNTKLENLLNSINEVPNKLQKESIQINKLPIKLGNKFSFINTNGIKYILASGYYAEIYSSEKKHLLREPLSSLIMKLNPNQFIRIHRSTIINIDYILEVIHSNYGETDVKMNDNELLRISKSYKKEFQKVMGLK